MLNICIVFAQLERETIQQRVKDAYYSRNKQGFYMGGKVPYGFQKEETRIGGIKTSKFVIDEEESAQLQMIFSMYADNNNSLSDIVQHLVDNGIQKLRGSPWNTANLSRVLCNPIYVKSDLSIYEFFQSQGANVINDVSEFEGQGCYLFQGTVSTTRKQNDLADKEVVLALHEGFISSDEWLKCRIRCLNNRQLTTTCKGKNSWLVGKMKCGNCGYAIQTSKSGQKKTRYGYCTNKYTTRTCDGTDGAIHIDDLEKHVFNAIKKKMEKFQSLSDHTKNKVQPKVKENEIKLVRIDNEINNLLAKVADANAILMNYINEKIEELDEERRTLQQENIAITQTIKSDKLNTMYEHVKGWEQTSFEDKQSVVDVFIEVIHLSKGAIDISWTI